VISTSVSTSITPLIALLGDWKRRSNGDVAILVLLGDSADLIVDIVVHSRNQRLQANIIYA
jgi:hypothetical protein